MKAIPLLLSAAAILSACSDAPSPAEAPRPVKVFTVGVSSGDAASRYSGEVRARHETTLGFRIGGKLVERLVDAGARVKPGQPLARLDPADVALQSSQAEAQRKLAEAEAVRYRDLRAKNFVSQAVLDAKETALAAANAQAGMARNQAAYSTLVADRAGIVAAVLAEPGQVVAAGQGVLRMAWDGEREIAIAVPESRYGELKVGDEAVVTLWSTAEGKTYRGRLRELAPSADAGNRTYAARVSIPDADAAAALGMTAWVAFKGESKTGLRAPIAALIQQGDAATVWVIQADNTVVSRTVKVTALSDAGAEISEGLKEGERIVAAGAHLLRAGEKVLPLGQPSAATPAVEATAAAKPAGVAATGAPAK
jgi:membrane fusion protein, multidrug efflux system